MTEENKFGIKESLDVVAFADVLVKKLHEKKADDGKIDGTEIGTALATSAPEAIKAIWGAGSVSKELGELSEEEKNQLLDKAMPVLLNLVHLFVPAK